MNIDFESLLEFEESLRSTSVTGNRMLLQNLALKIECARAAYYDNEEDTDSISDFTEQDLDNLFSTYKFTKDEFTTCSKCGRSLAVESLYQSCCKAYISNNSCIHSKLEKSFWLALINNPTRTINTLPCYTEFLCLKQGIPNQIRSVVWQKLFLLNTNKIPQTSNLVFNNFQHSYNSEISDQISKDLNRTFPMVEFFKTEKTITNLSTILNVYANYDAELGYCQGLLFLVGVLCYHFHDQSELTFHCLISIMESEFEVRDIFTASSMSHTLQAWQDEFLGILKAVDKDLFDHLTSFVEMNVFLYQWWLSFISSHSPDLSIVNRIMDFCIIQGWKNGLFKISLGLLLINKPILMSLNKGDEEVIYQHLLNESKWGNVINDLDLFFGDLLLSWDESLFMRLNREEDYLNESLDVRCAAKNAFSQNSSPIAGPSLVDKLKNFSILSSAPAPTSAASVASSAFRYRADSIGGHNRSSYSVFSNPKRSTAEMESIYSDLSDTSSSDEKNIAPANTKAYFSDYLKFPYLSKRASGSGPSDLTDKKLDLRLQTSPVEIDLEKERMKVLLQKAWVLLDDSDDARFLKSEIAKVFEV